MSKYWVLALFLLLSLPGAAHAAAPTASLSANPNPVLKGSNVALTWSSTNATSCTGTNFVTSGATSGTVSVTPPGSGQSYTLTCVGSELPNGVASIIVTTYTLPDITAASVTATTTVALIANQPVALSAKIYNQGNADAVAFPVVFQVQGIGYVAQANGVNTLLVSPTTTVTQNYTFTSAGNYNVRACGDLDMSGVGHVTESNEGNNCGAWTPITILAGAPDLTATGLNPTAVSVGTWSWPASSNVAVGSPITLTAIVYNGGTATTSLFANTFELVDPLNNRTYIPSNPLLLGPGQYGTTSVTYSISSFGWTFQVRLCSDTSYSVLETNESNNCGPYTTLVTAVTQALNVTCTPSAAPSGGYQINTPITWTATSNGLTAPVSYGWFDAYDTTAGTTTGNPFTNQYANGNGNAYSPRVIATGGGKTVAGYCSPATINSFNCSGSPTVDITANGQDGLRVQPNTNVSIDWTGVNIQTGTCRVTGTDGYDSGPLTPNLSTAQCAIPTGPVTRMITTQTKYTISCTGGGTDQVIINVVPAFKVY